MKLFNELKEVKVTKTEKRTHKLNGKLVSIKGDLYVADGKNVSVVAGKTASGKSLHTTKLIGELSNSGKRIKAFLTEEEPREFFKYVMDSNGSEEVKGLVAEEINGKETSETLIEKIDKEVDKYDVIVIDSINHEEVKHLFECYEGNAFNMKLILVTQLNESS